jgi:hypothetical protein
MYAGSVGTAEAGVMAVAIRTGVARLLHGCHTVVTRLLRGCCTVVTRLFYGCYTVVTRLSHGCHTVGTAEARVVAVAVHASRLRDHPLEGVETGGRTYMSCS